MKIVMISDTEGDHRESIIPGGDVLVYGGDIVSYRGVQKFGTYQSQLEDFIDWLGSQPHSHKIFIGGNHDDVLLAFDKKSLPEGVHYLENEEIVIDGIKFWGSPNTVEFFGMAFEEPEEKLEEIYKGIPEDVDVLITHVPPKGVLDLSSRGKSCGSMSLANRLEEISPKVHVFGHTHYSYGSMIHNDTECFNASFQNNRNKTQTIEI